MIFQSDLSRQMVTMFIMKTIEVEKLRRKTAKNQLRHTGAL